MFIPSLGTVDEVMLQVRCEISWYYVKGMKYRVRIREVDSQTNHHFGGSAN